MGIESIVQTLVGIGVVLVIIYFVYKALKERLESERAEK